MVITRKDSDLPNMTIIDLMKERIDSSPGAPAVSSYIEETKSVSSFQTWREFWDQSTLYHQILKRCGLHRGARIGVMLNTCPEYEMVCFGAMMESAVIVGLGADETPERLQLQYKIGCLNGLIVGTYEALNKFSSEQLLSAEIILVLEKDPDKPGVELASNIVFLSEALALADTSEALPFDLPTPNDPATIIFTSGTTGEPKGIAYSHKKIVFACDAIVGVFKGLDNSRILCWLPLANLFQRILNICAVRVGGQICFVSNPRLVMEASKAFKPNVFVGVPRLYEKVYSEIYNGAHAQPLIRRMIAFTAFKIARLHFESRSRPLNRLALTVPYKLFDYLIYHKIRSFVGGSIRFMISGSAPLEKSIAEFFHGIGLPVLEAYGISENVVPVAINTEINYRLGSVGRPLVKDSVKLSSDSEVLIKNDGLCDGYLNAAGGIRPLELIDSYYPTGDYGRVDDDGYVYLTGRKRDYFKTSTGVRVSPNGLEESIKLAPWVENCFVYGSGRKCLVALLSIDWPNVTRELGTSDIKKVRDYDDVLIYSKFNDSDFQSQFLEQVSDRLSSVKPAAYVILRNNFSTAGGELTSNLKLKRDGVTEKYRDLIDGAYELLDNQQTQKVQFFSETLLTSNYQIQKRFIVDWIPSLLVVRVLRLLHCMTEIGFILIWNRCQVVFQSSSDQNLSEKTWEKIAKVLRNKIGPLKGPLLKIGQFMSINPSDIPEPIQNVLQEFQIASLPLSSSVIAKCIKRELGASVDQLFEDWNNKPIASGTIGQVHRAKLHDGSVVAVKIQYPNIEKIVRNDLFMIRLILLVVKKAINVSNIEENFREMKHLMLRECNYDLEATSTEQFGRFFANDHEIVIPKLHRHYSSKRVLTMEFIEGKHLLDFIPTATQEEKNKAGITINRMVGTSLNLHCMFNADPHPGNYLFMENGKVGFLDFGFTKRWDREFMRHSKLRDLSAIDNDPEEFRRLSLAMGIGKNDPDFDYTKMLNIYRETIYGWFIHDVEFQFSDEFIQKEIKVLVNETFSEKKEYLPIDLLAMSRLFCGFHGIMADLQAKVNWHREVVPLLSSVDYSQREIPRVRVNPLSSMEKIIEKVHLHMYTKAELVEVSGFPVKVFCTVNPDYIQKIYFQSSSAINKYPPLLPRVKAIMGNGSYIKEGGDEWKARRQLTNKLFNKKPIEDYMATVEKCTGDLVAQWAGRFDGSEKFDLYKEIRNFVTELNFKMLFGVDLGSEVQEVQEITAVVENNFTNITPLSIPTPETIAFNDCIKKLRDRFFVIIQNYQMSPSDSSLLSHLFALAEKSPEKWDDEMFVDEMCAIYFGASAVSATLTWSLFLISKHPEVKEHIYKESESFFIGESNSRSELDRNSYLEMTFKECTRLYPISWGYPHFTTEDLTLGDFRIPARSMVIPMVYYTQRHPDFWKNPDEFHPARFLKPNAIHPYAYFPFGGGKRSCLGARLAPILIQFVLAAINHKFDLTYVGDEDPVKHFAFELTPAGSVMVNIRNRNKGRSSIKTT